MVFPYLKRRIRARFVLDLSGVFSRHTYQSLRFSDLVAFEDVQVEENLCKEARN